MKKILSLATLFVFAISLSFAQEAKPVKVNPVKATPAIEAVADAVEAHTEGPIMELETTEINYGVIEQGSDPLRIFHFSNTGTEPLVIQHAKGSCGCTVPSYPKEPILPGEKGVIEVRYDTKRIGKFTKRVTLTTNEVAKTKVLTIKGETFKKKAEPKAIPESTPSMLNPNNGN